MNTPNTAPSVHRCEMLLVNTTATFAGGSIIDRDHCQQCGTPASPGAKYCESCGAVLSEAQPESPPAAYRELQLEGRLEDASTYAPLSADQAPSYSAHAATMQYQGVGIRFVAILIDTIVIAIVTGIVTALLNPSVSVIIAPNLLAFVVGAASAFITFFYFVLMEGAYGQTIGKMIVQIQVVQVTGTKISYGDAVVRTILRIIDAIPYFIPYLLGAILIWTSDEKQRLGDRVARTVVVRA